MSGQVSPPPVGIVPVPDAALVAAVEVQLEDGLLVHLGGKDVSKIRIQAVGGVIDHLGGIGDHLLIASQVQVQPGEQGLRSAFGGERSVGGIGQQLFGLQQVLLYGSI